MSLRTIVLGAASLLLACAPNLSTPTVYDTTGSPIALFEPPPANDPCGGALPFPTDLAKNATTGGLNIPLCATDDVATKTLKLGLRTLGGWSVNTPIYTTFSKAIDPATVVENQTALLVDTGTQLPIAWVKHWDGTTNTLYFIPTSPLKENTTYLAAVTQGVKGTDGKVVISDQVFTFAKSRDPLVDAQGYSVSAAITDNDQANQLEVLRQGFIPMFLGFEETAGIDRSEVAIAWPFTTQTITTPFDGLAAMALAAGPAASLDNAIPAALHPLLAAAGIPATHLGCIYTGRVAVKNFVTAGGTFGVAGGVPVSSPLDVQYMFITPSSLGCGATWNGDGTQKVAVFAHGLGRCKNDVLAIADTLGSVGWAVLSLDGPHAGARLDNNLGDQNVDGCPDQGATPEIIGASPNPFAIRDNMREWGLELVQAAHVAAGNPWSLAGLDAPSSPTATPVALIGHSFGGMAAVMAGQASPDVKDVVTSAAPSEYGSMFQPLLAAAGYSGAALAEAVTTFRWVLEGGDPLYFAPKYATTKRVLPQIIAAGTGTVTDAPLHGTLNQQRIVGFFPALVAPAVGTVTFTMTSGSDSICTDSTTLVGAMLQPCAGGTSVADPDYAALATMRGQFVTFLVTGSLP